MARGKFELWAKTAACVWTPRRPHRQDTSLVRANTSPTRLLRFASPNAQATGAGMDPEPQRAAEKEGRRLRALRACFHRALRLALDCPTWEDFAVHFKDLPQQYRMALYDLYQQVLHLTRANSEAEFEDICEEAQLWTRLQDLEQLCQEQGIYEGEVQGAGLQGRVAPAEAAQIHRMQAKQEEKAELEAILAQMQEHQAELEARLQDKQLQVMQAAEQFQPAMANLEKVHHASKLWAAREPLQAG